MRRIERFYVGLATTFHDPAVAIVDESGALLFAEATERALGRRRAMFQPPDDLVHFPALIAEHCGTKSRLVVATSWSGAQARAAGEPDRVAHWPLVTVEGMRTSLENATSQALVNLALADTIRLRPVSRPVSVVHFDHHLAHAATACWTSPFEDAACVVVDGYGEHASSAWFQFSGGTIRPMPRVATAPPDGSESLGLFYAAVCSIAGFDPVQGEEWKVMGLAPYGQRDDELHALLRPIVRVVGTDLVPGCSPIDYMRRIEKAVARGVALRLHERGAAGVARTGQLVFEEVMTELLCNVHAAAGADRLVLGGGCALNSSFNGRIPEVTPFRAPHVPSAPADDGNALGAALLAWRADHPDAPYRPGVYASPYVGSRASAATLARLERELAHLRVPCAPADLPSQTAELLARGAVVAWMRGRAELGPRALGHRAIFADPRSSEMKARLNRAVKMREPFRPFAPAILDEHGAAWFDAYTWSPSMERALRVRPEKRALVPAVVHVDGTGRVQSVTAQSCPELHALLVAFHARTDVPLLLLTSFNVMGRPIVHSVEDAVATFFTTDLDALVIEDALFVKPTRRAPP